MSPTNCVRIEFMSVSDNVAFARVAVSSLASQLDLTLDEIEDIRLVVSEAVSNAIIHGYEGRSDGTVVVECRLFERAIEIVVEDYGKGIEDIEAARQPAFTTNPERMGMGMTLMEALVDRFDIVSQPGKGTRVTLYKEYATTQPDQALAERG